MRAGWVLTVLGAGLLAAASVYAAPHQLDRESFAACLQQAHAPDDVSDLRKQYRLGASDLLLLYLALYADVRSPERVTAEIQELAHERWSVRFEAQEAALAWWLELNPGAEINPGEFWSEAARVCGGDTLCAAVASHNVLRTLGRYFRAGQNLSAWFLADRTAWEERGRQIRKRLMSLLRDGTGERYGEWYHFFGILALGVRESALRGPFMALTFLSARANEILNPILAGGREEREKAELDRDTAWIAWLYLISGNLRVTGDCQDRRAYVLPLRY